METTFKKLGELNWQFSSVLMHQCHLFFIIFCLCVYIPMFICVDCKRLILFLNQPSILFPKSKPDYCRVYNVSTSETKIYSPYSPPRSEDQVIES